MSKTLLIIIALALVVAAFFGRLYWQNAQVPTLGHTEGQFTPLSSTPNNVSTQSEDPEKQVEPWPFIEDQSTTMQAILSAVQSYGKAEVVTQEADYLRVVFITPLMRYRDDAEFYLDSDSRQVHFRSASRAGHSDMGLNRERHQALTRLYSEQQN